MTSHIFSRELVFDIYDWPVQSVVWCQKCNTWFYKWLVAWKPVTTRRTYVFRRLSNEWIIRFIEELRVPATIQNWLLPFNEVTHERLKCLKEDLFRHDDELLIAELTDPNEGIEVSLQPVDPTALGSLVTPAPIEIIVDQDDSERERLHALVQDRSAH